MSSLPVPGHINERMLICSEQGFALPSILFLVTILSLVAASVIGLQYFMKNIALIDVVKVKAEYAAESGLAKALNDLRNPQVIEGVVSKMYRLEDGGESRV